MTDEELEHKLNTGWRYDGEDMDEIREDLVSTLETILEDRRMNQVCETIWDRIDQPQIGWDDDDEEPLLMTDDKLTETTTMSTTDYNNKTSTGYAKATIDSSTYNSSTYIYKATRTTGLPLNTVELIKSLRYHYEMSIAYGKLTSWMMQQEIDEATREIAKLHPTEFRSLKKWSTIACDLERIKRDLETFGY